MSQRDLNIASIAAVVGWGWDSACIWVGSKSCSDGKATAPSVRMIKLTEAREITPHKRVTFGRGALRCEASNVVPQRALAIRSAASQSTSLVTGKGAQLNLCLHDFSGYF